MKAMDNGYRQNHGDPYVVLIKSETRGKKHQQKLTKDEPIISGLVESPCLWLAVVTVTTTPQLPQWQQNQATMVTAGTSPKRTSQGSGLKPEGSVNPTVLTKQECDQNVHLELFIPVGFKDDWN